ncbi:MAG TPA: hypothetical protein PLM34_00045 [Lentimicrobium sp.]|nr:hypothetical protein [Lentimicrobium sp.]
MKTYKVEFQHDHFIEVGTNNTIHPKQGQIYILAGEDNGFDINQAKTKVSKSLDSSTKRQKMLEKYGEKRCKKILNEGEKLYFRVGKLQKTGNDKNLEFVFQCILLEDLYLYLKKDNDGNEPLSWRLANCNCRLEKCLLGGLEVFHKVESKSLNSLFTRTVMHYFSEQHSGSNRAFTTFFRHYNEKEITLYGAASEQFETLNKIRNRVADNYPKEEISELFR